MGEKGVMTAKEIQSALIWSMRGGEIVMPNYTPPKWWECDLFTLSKADIFKEYEIKISRSDFRNDAQKGKRMLRYVDNRWAVESVNKHKKLAERDVNGPMRFWFVAPAGIIPIEEVPAFAGLLIAEELKHGVDFRIEKKAPKLHSEKFSQVGRDDLMRTTYNRYRWNVICMRSKPDCDWGIEYQI